MHANKGTVSYIFFPYNIRHTFTLRILSFPLLPWGYTTAKKRSNAMAIRVISEEAAPIHAKMPSVTNVHNTFPLVPSG